LPERSLLRFIVVKASGHIEGNFAYTIKNGFSLFLLDKFDFGLKN
jgi:hypothetical protein